MSKTLNFFFSLISADEESPYSNRRNLDEKKQNLYTCIQDNRIAEDMIAQTEQKSLAQRIIRVAEALKAAGKMPEVDGLPLKVFGVKLNTIRRREGLSLEQLADRSKVDADLLLAIELGVAQFNQVITNLRPIGDALGGKYRYLSDLLITLVLDCHQ